MNESAAIHGLAQVAAEQAYHSVIASSTVASQNLVDSVHPITGAMFPNASTYPTSMPSLNDTHISMANNHTQSPVRSLESPRQLGSTGVDVNYPSLQFMGRPQPAISAPSINSMTDCLSNNQGISPFNFPQGFGSHQNESLRTPPPPGYVRSSLSPPHQYPLSPAGSSSDTTRSHTNEDLFQNLCAPRHAFSGAQPPPPVGGQKRDYDEAVYELISRCKRSKYEEDSEGSESNDLVLVVPCMSSLTCFFSF